MMIHRVKRLRQRDEPDRCDFCDEYLNVGYELSGEGVGGPRSGVFLRVCDGCLKRARQHPIGHLRQENGSEVNTLLPPQDRDALDRIQAQRSSPE